MTAQQTTPPSRRDQSPTSIAELVELVKGYAKQETLGPLKGAGKWLGMGAAGATFLGLGLSLIVLGVLRLVQSEWDRSARGSLSWLPYLIAFIVCVVFLALALLRINKDSLNKEPT